MKFLLALALLSVVCAIPRPGIVSAPSGRLEQLEPSQGSEQGNNQVGNTKLASRREQPSELENLEDSVSTEDDDNDDEDDFIEKVSLEDLIIIKTLNNIKDAIKKKIHNKVGHNKEEDNIYVSTERVPVKADKANKTADDSLQQGNSTSKRPQNNGSVSNNTKGNDTASDHIPKINITLIKKEINDKVNNIIANVLRPWLGNNSLEAIENGTAANSSKQANITVVDDGGISNVSHPSANSTNSTTNHAPHNSNSSDLEPPNGSALNKSESEHGESIRNEEATELPTENITESDDATVGVVEVNSIPTNAYETVIDNEIATTVPVERSQLSLSKTVAQNVKASEETRSGSQVRFVN